MITVNSPLFCEISFFVVHACGSLSSHSCTMMCTINSIEMRKVQIKTSRGYRLKPSTHRLIKSLGEITQTDSDKVLEASCTLYYRQIFKIEENKKLTITAQRKAS